MSGSDGAPTSRPGTAAAPPSPGPAVERRQVDRRSGDRRRSGGRRQQDSLFAALGVGDEFAGAESFFDPGWLSAGGAAADSRHTPRRARPAEAAQDSALVRIYRTYTAARAAIGVGLVVALGGGGLLGSRGSEWLALVSVAYAVQAITLWLLPRFGAMAHPPREVWQRRRRWLATIGVDLAAFTVLHLLAIGSNLNLTALLVLPVLMAGVMSSRLLALGVAAAVALMLLLAASRALLDSGDAPLLLLQSGMAGLGLFIITLLAGELAGRLVREEVAARGSLELARQQAQLNRLVIEEMADGVLVVDRRLRVRAANPAARALLAEQGLGPRAPFTLLDRAAWVALQQAVERALADGSWPEAGRDTPLAFEGGHTRTLRVRVRFMRSRAAQAQADASADERAGEPFAVVLLEDLRTLQARIRQEKLAAMGRVSAGIAHEIRNPLAAISQANALLLEEALPPAQARLASMVADNVARLKRLVDDVMEVAPGAMPTARAIDATAEVRAAAADWARTVKLPLGADGRLRLDLPAAPLAVMFDPEHLRRVLVNLLDNAQRHASAEPGAILLRLAARDAGSALMSVCSDGPPIPPEVERHLFEPFFSTRSRGSGLGLYICRELCESFGASIEYRPRPAAERLRNEFVVSLRRAAAADPTRPTTPS